MKLSARYVAALMMVGLLGCSSVGNDCLDCAAGGNGGAAGAAGSGAAGAAGSAAGGAAGHDYDGNFCGTLTRPLVEGVPYSCTFDLGPLPTTDGRTDYGRITIFIDGTALPRDPDHDAGWDYVDTSRTSITLYGWVCSALQSGDIQQVTVAFMCIDV